ncbi:MAG: DUF4136 domain-containing protein [Acidobacteriota bacterium]
MKPSRLVVPVAALAALALSVSCASLRVNSFTVSDADFSRYQTYGWAPTERLSTGDPRLDNNPFFQDSVQKAVEQRLEARGFERAAGAAPDLILHYHASVTQRIDVGQIDLDYDGCHDCNLPTVYDAGSLVLDVVEARSNRLIWRGWAEGSMEGAIDNQAWMARRMDEAVARILERLPRRL